MNQTEIMVRQEKARNRRYKKPIVNGLNIDMIRDKLCEISYECEAVKWLEDDNESELLDDLIGGEEEACEFKMMFSMLSADCDRMIEDIDDAVGTELFPDCFDFFFAAMAQQGMTFMGYDDYVQDYMGLDSSYEEQLAIEESIKRMERMTKKEILKNAKQCFRIYMNYISLTSRYEDLKASMDVIKGHNRGFLELIRQIEAAYSLADEDDFREYSDSTQKFNRLTADLPAEIWIQ